MSEMREKGCVSVVRERERGSEWGERKRGE